MKIVSILVILTALKGLFSHKDNPCLNADAILDRLQGDTNQIVCFETIDSYDFDFQNKQNIVIHGKLNFPKEKKDFYNAVVLSHGSGGVRRYHEKYVKFLNQQGYVVFQLDHYMGRNIKYDKTFSKVSGITFMNDAYKALALIKTNKKINKVAYIGWSQGGVGPILSHFKNITNFIDGGKNIFDASVAIYPYCGFTFEKDAPINEPLLMITGASDDLTPEKACINIYKKFNDNIEHISMEGARHGFDNPFLFFGFTFDKLPSLHVINDDCTLTINQNGKIVTLSGQVIDGPEKSAETLNNCSSKGVKVKYNAEATERTRVEIINFLKKVL